ncbi:hypothetical protein H5410_059872, partial [Solanum commersonii]
FSHTTKTMKIGFVNQKDCIKLEILWTKLIKPCLPTPPHLQRYKLSFFDQLSEKEHVPFVLFYANNNFINNSTIDERLEQSLSKILTHVYPVAGMYDKDECSILCLDQGVSYTKAKVNCKLDNFLEKTSKDLGLAGLFWPHENKNVNETNLMVSPIVIAQVTEFECGGLAMSLSGSHPAMDGFSNVKFLFEWAKVCRMGTPVEEFVNKKDCIKIEILWTKLIKPCLPTPPHLQRYELSFFDQLSEKEHVPFVLFYANNNNFINNSTIDERLEQSLSKILTHVYPAAGRYDKDECSILCLDQGVSYTKAKVNCKLDNFLEKTHKDLGLASLFWPHVNKNIDQTNLMVSPIVTAQVTEFECGGLAVSLSGSHPAMDFLRF